MVITFRYRLLPKKAQHRAFEMILESQRQLYNAALEERIDAYRKRGIARSYFDQTKALTQWRQEDADARLLPVALQRGTLKRVDDAFSGFFSRVRGGAKPGFPRFRKKDGFHSFGFRVFMGITLHGSKLRFKGMPGTLRINCTGRCRHPRSSTAPFAAKARGGLLDWRSSLQLPNPGRQYVA